MKRIQSLKYFAAGVLLPLSFLYWPVACATSPVKGATTGTSSEAVARGGLAADGAVLDELSVADVAERVTPSVVSISISAERAAPRQFPFGVPFPFGMPQPQGPQKQKGLGSGVIVSAEGIVLTNNHVIEDASEIQVTLGDGAEYEAELVGADAKSDLAVLRLKGDFKNLRPIKVGDSSKLRLGEIVLAIGNPFGVGQTVTMGIVSAKGRADVGIVDYEDFIQTDAAINPGNSGGALVNLRGELVGVNTAILSRSGGYQGIGFAIPTNMAQPIVDSLRKHGKVVRGFLGVNIQDIDPALAHALGLKDSSGVLVAGVSPGSAAEKAGVLRGDVITQVDGTPVETTGRLRNVIAATGAEKSVALHVVRDGKPIALSVKLGSLTDEEPGGKPVSSSEVKESALGMALSPLTPELAERFDLRGTAAKVIVRRVAPGSKAAEAGVRPGDAVLEVNKRPVASPEAAASAFESPGDVLIVIQRGSSTRYLVIDR